MISSNLITKQTKFGSEITYPDDSIIGKNLNETGYWEEDLSKFLISFLSSSIPFGKTVLDIGGHVGYFSLLFNHAIDNPIIHTFEPCRDLYQLLQRNTLRFNNIITHNYAVHTEDSSDNKCTEIYRSLDNTGDNSLIQEEIIKWNGDNFYTDYCFVKSIFGFGINSFNDVAVVKIDTQGSELKILKGLIKVYPKAIYIIEKSDDLLLDYLNYIDAKIHFVNDYDIVFSR